MIFESIRRIARKLTDKYSQSGQTLVEYGLIVALIAVTAIVGISLVAGGVDSLWGWILEDVTTAVEGVLT